MMSNRGRGMSNPHPAASTRSTDDLHLSFKRWIRLTQRILRQHIAEGATAHRLRVEVAEWAEHLQKGSGRLTDEWRTRDAPPVRIELGEAAILADEHVSALVRVKSNRVARG